MSNINIAFRQAEKKIGKYITADLFVNVNPTYSRKIARHPVEAGVDFSDHITLDPRTVTVSGIISDRPLDYNVIQSTPDFYERIRDVYDELLRIWNDTSSTTLVDIISGDKEYKNMCLVRLNIPQDQENGEALFFEAYFEEIRTIDKKYVQIEYISEAQNTKVESAPEKNVGDQVKGDVEEVSDNVSKIKNFVNWIVGG